MAIIPASSESVKLSLAISIAVIAFLLIPHNTVSVYPSVQQSQNGMHYANSISKLQHNS